MPWVVLESALTVVSTCPCSCNDPTDVFFFRQSSTNSHFSVCDLPAHPLSPPTLTLITVTLFLASGPWKATPCPLEVRFPCCWTPQIAIPPFSTELLAKASHQITCYVQSQQPRDATICWGHTRRDQVEWLAFWWPLWQPTDGMCVCFRTERRGLLLCHLSGRLQACRPRGTRPRNVFTPPKGTTRRNAWKDFAVPTGTRRINETLISFLIEPCCSSPSRS